MRLQNLLTLWPAIEVVLAGPVAREGKLSQEEFYRAVLNSPHMVPPKSFRTIETQIKVAADPPKAQSQSASWLDSITAGLQILSDLPGMLKTGSTSPDVSRAPKSTAPEVVRTKSPLWPEATRVKIRYGPYRMPPKGEKNFNWWLWNVGGSATNLKYDVKKPCNGNCAILSIQADLEYFDGSNANLTNEAFFHHNLILNTGQGVKEATCGQPYIENIFLSGQEKTLTNYTSPRGSKYKSGYRINPTDTFAMLTELQNYAEKEQFVWQVVIYDIVENIGPEYKHMQPVWLTVGHTENPSLGLCTVFNNDSPFGPSNLTDQDYPKAMKFSEHSKKWKAMKNGRIVATGGHLHAGGINMEIYHNQNMFCNSTATYGKAGDGHAHSHRGPSRQIEGRQIKGGNYSNMDIEHILGMSICQFPDGIPVRQNDTVHIQANYDFNVRKGVKNAHGDLDQVMAMASLWVLNTD